MLKRHKDFLRAVVAELRHVLTGYANGSGAWQRGDLDRELERLGIAPDGAIMPLDALPNPTGAERRARYVADAQLASLQDSERTAARTELVERAAYSWINRLLALRVMEARGLIDETLRSNPEYGGVSEALYLLRSQAPDRTAGPDGGWWAVVEDACAAQSATLPGLFDPRDPAVALRPSTPALLRCVALVGNVLPGYTVEEAKAAFADPDAIGWAYQFYQEEAKARTYAKLGAGGKAETRAEIAAVTQLFTERYMVQWLLQNSLGRSYHEAYPDSKLPATWAYYVRRPEDGNLSHSVKSLSELTVMDPCMGSGHFKREAFDMLAAMYREQEPGLSAAEVADRILSHHLYGVDIDPRAAQLAALTLYLRAWELVREEHRAERRVGPATYRPPRMNLATTPTGLSAGALERHLRRHPEDLVFEPLLDGIFAALERADLLGSLLQPGAQLDAAIAKLQQPHTVAMDFDADQSDLRRTITELAGRDPAELKRMLLDRIAASFAAEVGSSDVGADLFGREAEQGVRLLELLDRRYAVVCTNPPYMGSGNMAELLRTFVERDYQSGKRDIYAAFILRCLALCRSNGRVAMVTQQSWMFLSSFSELRALPQDRLTEAKGEGLFTGLLHETSIETLAHLGPNAFEEISGEVVQSVMFTLAKRTPRKNDRLLAFRLVDLRNASDKAQALLAGATASTPGESFSVALSTLTDISGSPIVYSIPGELGRLISEQPPLGRGRSGWFCVRDGINTGDNDRFVRFHWETSDRRWCNFSKGGGYSKWVGLEYYVVDWGSQGDRVRYADLPGTAFRNLDVFFKPALCYSLMAQGALGVRFAEGSAYDGTGLSVQLLNADSRELVAAVLNSHLASYLARLLSQGMKFRGGYVERLPQPGAKPTDCEPLVAMTIRLKCLSVATDPCEVRFGQPQLPESSQGGRLGVVSALRHMLEGIIESRVLSAYGVSEDTTATVLAETGAVAGLFSLIAGYDCLPDLPAALGLPQLPSEAIRQFAVHPRVPLLEWELGRLKSDLRGLYEIGPGAGSEKRVEVCASQDLGDGGGRADIQSPARVTIPSETFIEELSCRLRIHPISVYWLLEELRADGVRCKPEEQRTLEDRLSVMVLRLLGHRWPKQIEACEPVPDWADGDGIIPITPGTDKATVAERLRERLRAEDGDLGAQRAEALLQELAGLSLEEWVRRQFFPRHVRQFKYRPIAWHLASTSRGGGGKRDAARRQPAFECLVYYHACAGDVLARLRSRYLQPLVLVEQRRAEDARRAGDETGAALAAERIAELEAFAAKLRQVDEESFACPELDELMAVEPLDRWSGDGRQAPLDREELLRSERAWHVDINDGVRVNIAPLQLAGVLAGDVLKTADARKAIADRSRWRTDERRWVREGKLPRCGWMGEDVQESPQWGELALHREAVRRKLEKKRMAPTDRLL